MTAQEVLLKAADHIERYGWRQHANGSAGNPCCIVGAAAAVTSRFCKVYIDALTKFEKSAGAAPASWNDTPGRTAAEVIAALRAAAGATP